MASPETASPASTAPAAPRILKRWGGRHLIFRNRVAGKPWVPRPYALISNFGGPVWFFFGLGQVWVTHRKLRKFQGWTARIPRVGGARLAALLDELEPALTSFIDACNEHGIEGTLVIEPHLIEFHWTFGYELEQERQKPDHVSPLDAAFEELVRAYCQCAAVAHGPQADRS